VPKRYNVDPRLRGWVGQQRTLFKNGILDQERKRSFEETGFEFSVQDKAFEKIWNSKLQNLREYYENYGHCELRVGSSHCQTKTPWNQ
jgi:hypothetical protein